ncbi:uncharacterized protein LOC107221394 isoform X1 [Neodiprion lecontei]|uniref:Uncharacterized protein LOC107221394 isoform X1 n=1 Tax=Neodiprion lecontei TaxID=441921 RepID=A0ABM3FVV5_NEOLC|nr:uncharacterized protein LOC107221394 isoform X1 [Neodiprion lecontei]XP_046592147.1 uncharacterized protein LOC107221394 isoform X1 [Neodiprion lecontei]XP_046592148.1 uncharacterized protein LOC107221394 isoform X1 [Neodiprion lecontei]
MSGANVEESSYLKVEHDFEYRTNDGRQIAIKKDERLYLIQKTNNDWWKVIRNKEQRSFYVPVTYVTELGSVSSPNKFTGPGKHDAIFQTTSRDHSARRRNVENWLSTTVKMLPDGSRSPENLEQYNRLKNFEDAGMKEIKNRIVQQKQSLQGNEKSNEIKNEKKSLERFRNVVRKISSSMHVSQDTSAHNTSARNSQTRDVMRTVMENVDGKSAPASNYPIYSPKEAKEPDRTLFEYQNPPQQQILHSISHCQKSAMNLTNPTGCTESIDDCRSVNLDSSLIKHSPRSRPSTKESKLSVQKNIATKRSDNNSTDRCAVTPNIEKKPSSPISAGNKVAMSSTSPSLQGSGSTFDYSENAMRILNDKRKSWAVEELMSELTQIRKERVDDNASNFVLRSIEIKDGFDPLEKLTQELHDLHTSQHENSTVSNSPKADFKSEDDIKEPPEISICKEKETTIVPLKSPKNLAQTESTFNKSKSPKSRISLTNSEVCSISTDINNSCKFTKRQDEYEEANILNDESRMPINVRDEGSDRKATLSADKEHYVLSYQQNSQLFKSESSDNLAKFEKPSYSNVLNKLKNETKVRPQLKLKIKNVDTKIKLTPSLEKLASEIQFLPASRTSIVDSDTQQSTPTENKWPQGRADQKRVTTKTETIEPAAIDILESRDDLINVDQDSEMWKNFKSKLNYRGSFKSKQEQKSQVVTKDVTFDNEHSESVTKPGRRKIKKSATFNCVAVPEYYKHFQRHEGSEYCSRISPTLRTKRRSQSLENIKLLVNRELKHTLAASKRADGAQNALHKSVAKPIPSCRKIQPMKDVRESIGAESPCSHQGVQASVQVLPPSISRSYENLNEGFNNLKVFDANKSTAVSFKNLLCTSDSGSDEYLHYKAFPKSSISRNERLAFSSDSKINSKVVVSSESLPVIDRSISDEQILSSNISSEALFSQSESEVYALSEVSNTSSPITVDRDRENFVNLPPGWTQEYDQQSKQICFVNTWGEKWFSSNDAEGKIYFFEENSNESSWILPSIPATEPTLRNMEGNHDNIELRTNSGSEKLRIGKARSLLVGNQRPTKKELAARRSGSLSHDWPQLFDGNMCILKEGILQRTKITENGKKLRKHWSTSYVVLSELFLLFFKDAKSFSAMKSGQSAAAKPDISVDLNGAIIEPDDKVSSRKNVYIISTILGLQVLIQNDNTTVANEWFKEIYDVIHNLPSGFEAQTPPSLERPRDTKSKQFLSVNSIEESKVVSKIGRTRSVKTIGNIASVFKKIEGSTEDLSGSSAERQTKIKAKLKRFFQRRPTMDSLVKNGIYKDEPAFGSYLKDVCSREPPMVPRFVKSCIEILESNLENMKADGLYRASGNLSQIQKIRLQVDQNNFDILAQEEDVHVLTGALKLFFRELKEPLIPYEFFERALRASMSKKKSEKIQVFREIVRGLSQPHYDTLQLLLQHLLKVTSYQKYNRMHIPNLAIVFGPTLMWPRVESANMALDLMQQNLVIECLLSEYDKIFK